jgi:hypothetical protein
MEAFKQYLTEQTLSSFSVDTYVSSMNRLGEIIGMDFEDIDYAKVNQLEKKIRASEYALNTKKTMVTAILKYVEMIKTKQVIVDKWLVVHTQMKEEIMKIEKQNKLKPSEEEKYMPYDEMRTKFLAYYDGLEDKARYDAFLLGCLLLLPAPTRLGNYRNLQVKTLSMDNYKDEIAELDDSNNYIIRLPLNTRTTYFFVFNDYKTQESVGKVVVQVEDQTLKSIIEAHIGEKDDVIFDDIVPASQTMTLKRITERIYGKAFSVNIIRHAFITYIYDTKQMSVAEKEEILKLFGNKYKPNQSDLYYRVTDKK